MAAIEESRARIRGAEEAERVRSEAERARMAAEEAPLKEALADVDSVSALRRCPPAFGKQIASGAWDREAIAVKMARKWAAGSVRGLVLRGGVGTGKSFAAACAVAEHSQKLGGYGERRVSWHRPNDFASGMLHAYDERAPKIGSELVVIDDIGRETKVDFEESLVVFLDDRETRIVITTNMTREEMKARYGARLIDRLDHECLFVSVSGDSKRRSSPGGF
jgi:DNA replication protein DnaC